jgi:hypothetical protein
MDTVAVKISFLSCTGLVNNEADAVTVKVFPNPATGEFVIEATEKTAIQLINYAGQKVREFTLDASNGYKANVSDLAAGVYFITAPGSTNAVKAKVIISN